MIMKKTIFTLFLIIIFTAPGALAQIFSTQLEVKYSGESPFGPSFPAVEVITTLDLRSIELGYPHYYVDAFTSKYDLFFNGTKWVFTKTTNTGTTEICANNSVAVNPLTGIWNGCISVLAYGTATCDPPTLVLAATPSGSSFTLTAALGGGAGTLGVVTWSPGGQTGNTITVSPSATTMYTATASVTNSCLYTPVAAPGDHNKISQSINVIVSGIPLNANAGGDQLNICGLVANLSGDTPEEGQTGVWTIISGEGGILTNNQSPSTSFTGIKGNVYELKWTVSNGIETDEDNVLISFVDLEANAGPDQLIGNICGTIALAANDPPIGNWGGYWSVADATTPNTEYSFSYPSSKNSFFNGTDGVTYVLRWTISDGIEGGCSVYDDVSVQYVAESYANAGIDFTGSALCGQTSVTLQAENLAGGTGSWTISSGSGGVFSDQGSTTSTFSGVTGVPYTLKWKVSKPPCPVVEDEVEVYFNVPVEIAGDGDEADNYVYAETVNLTLINDQCRLIGKINAERTEFGDSPGVLSSVVIDPNVKIFNAQTYLQRHFDLSTYFIPEPETYEAVITLYVSQSDFTNFNSASTVKLPINAADVENYKTNLRIWQWHGTPTTTPSSPGNYTGAMVAPIDPVDTDIKWDAALSAWGIKFNVVGFSGFYITAENAMPLPVTLLNFKAQKQENLVVLNWQTTEETNSDRFEIERSIDAKNWGIIGEVQAKGESTGLVYYSFQDVSLSSQERAGVRYYRLKMLDRDGTFAYSRIASVDLEVTTEIKIFPNPAIRELHFTSDAPVIGYKFMNPAGIKILEKIGLNTSEATIKLPDIQGGVYLLQLTQNDGTVHTKQVVITK
jgi:hypothetical protein